MSRRLADLHPSDQLRVEQAVAFGRSLEWMRSELHVTEAQVEAVREWLDEVTYGYVPPTAPCGSRSAYARHLRNAEPVDDLCRAAERMYQAGRKRLYRRARRAA